PRTVATFFEGSKAASIIEKTFDYTEPIGMVIYVVLIIAFTYFYTFVQVNPEQMAENLQKQGGYIPGIDRKSTRLNSSHVSISYAVFCLKKKNVSFYYRAHVSHDLHGERCSR